MPRSATVPLSPWYPLNLLLCGRYWRAVSVVKLTKQTLNVRITEVKLDHVSCSLHSRNDTWNVFANLLCRRMRVVLMVDVCIRSCTSPCLSTITPSHRRVTDRDERAWFKYREHRSNFTGMRFLDETYRTLSSRWALVSIKLLVRWRSFFTWDFFL